MLEYTALLYAQRLLDQGLLRPLTPGDKNEIEGNVNGIITFVQEAIHGTRSPARTETARPEAPEPMPAEEMEYIEYEETYPEEETLPAQVEEAEATVEEEAELIGWTEEAHERLLSDLRQQLIQEGQHRGLLGVDYFLGYLEQQLEEKLEQARVSEADLSNRIEVLQNQLNSIRYPVVANLLNFWPFDMLFVSNVRRSVRQERVAISNEINRLRYRLGHMRHEKVVWDRLVPMMGRLRSEVSRRIQDMDIVRGKGITEARARFFRVTRQARRDSVYELTSYAVDDQFIVGQFAEDNWQRLLINEIPDSLEALIGNPYIFQLRIGVAEHRRMDESVYGRILQLESALPTAPEQLISWLEIYEYLMDHSSRVVGQAIPEVEFHLTRILAANRALLEERIKQLFARCYPFWRYDLDKGGFDEQDLEQTLLVGVDDSARNRRLYDDIFRDYGEFERVSTGDPLRIDACNIHHGLPLPYLENMRELYRHYWEFLTRGPIHLRPEWRDLPEVVLPMEQELVELSGDGRSHIGSPLPTKA
ncbi:MAG TPA: hypothetical protein EYP04_03745 [Anaerolineae bacterium]|nr:hypothetical protein [Anaerolineae bacterium]HIQ05319.1 hypothetical protein [Anaerolineae bacterium]